MKNKDQQIEEVKDQMRALADKLEALETVETAPKPERGEVWADWNGSRFIIDANGGMAYHSGSHYSDHCSVTASNAGDCKRLGTFDEVYCLRSDSKVQIDVRGLEDKLARWEDSEGDPIDGVHIHDLAKFIKEYCES
jgi:hypothetical protein